ncbi:hypothetical protein O3P69_013084 [Scylla paramamosain]|uniref:Uncharacterized protein n=1 Tax=Scylla paramamosain TaxID=85552 RepID=A0AAW0SDP5_SCYPA
MCREFPNVPQMRRTTSERRLCDPQHVFVYIHQHCAIRGAMFDQDSRVIQSAFLHAIQHYSQNTAGRRLQLHAFVGIISMADAFKISRLM